ncbi:MAG: GTP-binding protein [Burkholderiales bacterium]|nr:GTP-binding protein [Burkholderiales bacterium]
MNGPGPAGGAGVSVIGGYLGSGKTTLVNHLLQHSGGMRLAVLVNDFGAIAIDASLVVSRSTSVISLSGGCVCCSFGSDLIGALQSLPTGAEAPHAILIETSGVALPRIVLQSASLVPGMTARGVTTVTDAETLLARAADRFLADTVARQVSDADVVLLNKVDLVSAAAAQRAEDWIRAINPSAEVVRTERAEIGPEAIVRSVRGQVGRAASLAAPQRPAARQFRSEEFVPEGAVDVEWLARELARPERRLLRAKGLLLGRDGALQVLQVAGERCEVSPAASARGGARGLVCIARDGDMDRAELAGLIDAARFR